MQVRAPGASGSSETPTEAWKRVGEPLRLQLTHLVGGEGFQALLSRAVALAKQEFPCLEEVRIGTASSLTGLDEILATCDPTEVEAVGTAVLSHLLWLLVTLIGADLTRQLASSAWPETPLGDIDLDAEEREV
jgi:hypothetical protein